MNLNSPSLFIRQRYELAELIGFETRNKYEITDSNGLQVAFAVEQSKGILGFLFRQFLGHWRPFEVLVFDPQKNLVMKIVHPFRFFWQRFEIQSAQGKFLGVVQQRWAILSKKFDVHLGHGEVSFTMRSPVWKIWTFPIKNLQGQEVATIRKKWAGLLSEGMTDKDNFELSFQSPALSDEQKMLFLACGLFIDLQYFERKS